MCTCSWILVLLLSLCHVTPHWYSHLVMFHSLIFKFSHLLQCCSFQMAMGSHVNIDTLSCNSIWYSHMILCSSVDIFTWSWITLLLFSFGHVSPYWYSHLSIYCQVDIHTFSCVSVSIFTIGHVSPCCYLTLVMCP